MANLTRTQKKNRNKVIALVIGIIAVLALIALVVYNGLTVASFGNEDFEAAVAQALGEEPGSVDKSVLEAVKYVEVGNDGNELKVFFGYDDYFAQLDKYSAEQEKINAANQEDQTKRNEMMEAAKAEAKAKAEEAGETFDEEAFTEGFDMSALVTGVVIPEATINHPVELTKNATVASPASLVDFNDIKHFKNAKEIVVMGAKINAETVLSLKNTVRFAFQGCQMNDVTELAKLDFKKVEKLAIDENMLPYVVDAEGNVVDIDNKALEVFKPFGDKVSITFYYPIQDSEGNIMQYIPYENTITEYFASLAAAEEEAKKAEEEKSEEKTEEQVEEKSEEDSSEAIIGGADEPTEIVVENPEA